MKEWLKRSFALLLCMIMCLSLLPEVHVHAEDATGDEIVVVADTQGEEQAVETDTVLEAVQPVRVEFVRDPEELTLTVYDENGEEIEAEEDGSYLLIPGQYSYTATCEGYAAAENVEFTVEAGNEPIEIIEIKVSLTKNQIPFSSETANTAITVEKTNEVYAESAFDDTIASPMGASTSEITQQIKDTYRAALNKAGRSSFNGYCGLYVNWQLVVLGINTSYVGANGNQEFDNYKDMSKSSGGYSITAYPASSYSLSSALNAISSNGTKDVYNILVGFETGSGSDGALYGHTCFIHAIIGGTVYFSDSFSVTIGGSTYSEGSPIACSIATFSSYYNSWTTLDGLIHFSSGSYLDQCTSYPSYLELTVKSGALKSLPCSSSTNAESITLRDNVVGEKLTAIGMYKNTANNYWYKVTVDGKTGYVWAGDVTVSKKLSSISYAGKDLPTNLPLGQVYAVDWTINSSYLNLKNIDGYIYGGSNFSTQRYHGQLTNVNATSKNLNASSLDYALLFDKLEEGTYKLVITASVTNNYSTDGETFSSEELSRTPISCIFTIGDHTHSYTDTVVAPTCTGDGYTLHSCSCGYSYRDNTVAAKGHSYGSTVTKQATCTEAGVRTYTCSVCGNSYTESIAALGHSYTSQTIEGSCTQRPGVKYTCTRCGDTYTEYADGNWSEWSTTKPTGVPESAIQTKTQYRYRDKETTTSSSSTLDGWTQSGSETVWSDFGEWSAWSTNYVAESESTQVETRTGYHYYYYVCSNCGAHMHGYGTCYTWAGGCGKSTISSGSYHKARYDTPYSSSLDWHGTGVNYIESSDGKVFAYISTSSQHYVAPATEYRSRTRTQSTIYSFYRWTDWSSWSDTAATASDSREVETRQMYRYDLYATAEHSWNSGVVTTAAGCETEGVRTYTCTACGETRTETIPATGHTAVTDPAVAATCTTAGKTEGSHCSVCNAVIKAQTTIPATGHTAVTDPAVAATCTTAGKTEGSHCSVCGEVIVAQTTIPATGHNFGEWVETRAPSLTEDGEETRTCQNPGCDVSETRAVKAVIYTVSYNANGGTGAPEAQQKLKGTALTLSTKKPVYSGYTFQGWATSSTATAAQYQPGGSYTEDKNVTLYAVWQKAGIEIGQLIVSTPQARPGETVTVDVSIAENPGICAFTLQVSYDETVLELVSIEHPEIGSNSIWNINGGKVSWLSFSDTDYNGTLFTVTFKVADDAEEGTAAVTVLYESGDIGNFAEDEINPSIQAGGVNIVKRVPGDTNGDGRLNTMDLIRLMKYFNGENVEVVPGSADINGDGRENTMDLIRLMKYISGEDVEIH